jgi:hypothetical protein
MRYAELRAWAEEKGLDVASFEREAAVTVTQGLESMLERDEDWECTSPRGRNVQAWDSPFVRDSRMALGPLSSSGELLEPKGSPSVEKARDGTMVDGINLDLQMIEDYGAASEVPGLTFTDYFK